MPRPLARRPTARTVDPIGSPRRLVALWRRVVTSPFAVPLTYVVAGVLLATATIALDRAVAPESLPAWFRTGRSTAESLTTGLAASLLFVVSVVYSVRTSALQMSAGPFSARVLSRFLTDRAQRHAMGSLIGILTYTIAVARSLPESESAPVPQLSVMLATVLSVAAAIVIVLTLHNAASWGEIGTLVRWLTDACLALVESRHPARGEGDPGGSQAPTPPRPGTQGRVVRFSQSGWVQRIDEDAVLAAVPPGATVELAVRVGVFVVEDTPLCTVWSEHGDDVDGALLRGVVVGTDPELSTDLGYGIDQLVDIAERSTSSSATDFTTAREVVLHLGVVLRALMLRDLPSPLRLGPDDRRLLRPHERSFDDYVTAAFDRVRVAGAGSPALATSMLTTIGALVRELEDLGLPERTEALHEQARLVVDTARAQVTLPSDADRVRECALAEGLLPTESPEAAEPASADPASAPPGDQPDDAGTRSGEDGDEPERARSVQRSA